MAHASVNSLKAALRKVTRETDVLLLYFNIIRFSTEQSGCTLSWFIPTTSKLVLIISGLHGGTRAPSVPCGLTGLCAICGVPPPGLHGRFPETRRGHTVLAFPTALQQHLRIFRRGPRAAGEEASSLRIPAWSPQRSRR